MVNFKLTNLWILVAVTLWTIKQNQVLASDLSKIICIGDIKVLFESDSRELLLKVLDSMGKPPSGILLGNYNWDGNPEECMRTKSTYEGFHLQYCYVFWHFNNGSSGDEFLQGRLGLCLPRSCNSDIIPDLLQEVLKMVGAFNLLKPGYIPERLTSIFQKFSISKVQCTNENHNLNSEGKLILCLFLFYICLVTVASVVDYIHTKRGTKKTGDIFKEANRPGKLSCIVKCFSIQRNVCEITHRKENDEDIDNFFNILRVVSFLQVLLFFAYFRFIVDGTPKYKTQIINMQSEGSYNYIMYSSPLDSFLFIGGFLFAKSYTKKFQRGVKVGLSFLTVLASRYIRLVPAFMFVVYFRLALWRFLSSSFNRQQDLCQDSSLRRLWSLFLDFKQTEHCLFIGWYLACDFKFFLLGLIIMLCFRRSNLAGKFSIATFWITSLVVALISDSQNFNFNSFDSKYLQYWMFFFFDWKLRIGSYLIGLLLGMAWIQSDRFQRHRIGNIPGLSWILWGMACMSLSTYRSHLVDQSLLLSSFSHVLAWNLWTLGLASVFYGVQVTDFPEWIPRLGSTKSVIIVNSLSYSASLLLEPVLDYVTHNSYNAGDYTPVEKNVLIIGVAVTTFVVALPFSLLFELPFVQLGRLLRNPN